MSNFIRNATYEKKNWDIVGVDKISTSSALNSIYVSKYYTNHIADITDNHIFSRIVEYERPDIIIHAAAYGSNELVDVNSRAYYERNNILGTGIVSNVAVKFGVKKLIYISTDSVYGQLKSENDPSWEETDNTNPRNIYSSSKLIGEKIISECKIKSNIIRISNSYGYRQGINNLIPKTLKSIFNNDKVIVFNQGKLIRDWMHVKDSFSGIVSIIENGENKEIYNLGAGQEFSDLEAIQLIHKSIKSEMNIEFDKNEIDYDFRHSLNCSKLKKLGWSPKIKFRDGILDVVNWFDLNRYWLK